MIISENKIINAITNLKKGNIIIYATDTLYGLSADATNTSAIQKINNLKKRNSPLSVMIDDIKSIKKYANLDSNTFNNINKILPGPFTILLKAKKNNLSYLVQNESDKIGIRIPNTMFCLNLLKKYKKPIITTSVNIHDKEPLNNIDEIERNFPDINIYKNGINKSSKGSTIIDFTFDKPKVIRQGDGEYIL